MEISDRIRVSDLRNSIHAAKMDEGSRKVMLDLIARIDLFVQDMVLQLRGQTTVYTVNPYTNPEAVSGAKPGDIAVYKNQYGDVEITQF